jgi:general secretion pathway protein N
MMSPSAPQKPTLNLVGTVEGNNEGYAVFIDTISHNIVRLKTGEGEDGWILRSVSEREAVLYKNDRTEVLELPPITGRSTK